MSDQICGIIIESLKPKFAVLDELQIQGFPGFSLLVQPGHFGNLKSLSIENLTEDHMESPSSTEDAPFKSLNISFGLLGAFSKSDQASLDNPMPIQPLIGNGSRLTNFALNTTGCFALASLQVLDLWCGQLGQRSLPSQTWTIWHALRATGVRLQSLSTDDVSPALNQYISSYSGLEQLTIKTYINYWHEEYVVMSPLLASEFFKTALPLHTGTLRHLSLNVNHSRWGSWWFGEENAGLIRELEFPKLRMLNIGSFIQDLGLVPPEGQDYLQILLETTLSSKHFPCLEVVEAWQVTELETRVYTPPFPQQDREDQIEVTKIQGYRFPAGIRTACQQPDGKNAITPHVLYRIGYTTDDWDAQIDGGLLYFRRRVQAEDDDEYWPIGYTDKDSGGVGQG
ncbi:hypothetical protein FA15DRAFT_655579 [Coprinopsis marcescibilis]|uniref:F-box domain-containing protein n=1 Tax=Coprinopsis marcescibilis TaxID=230819 RepID=A0A5C3KWK5_COPMA|nr:hypothetical protein FA15DRAFT_655579 [Coprinopsis marcescibilis]